MLAVWNIADSGVINGTRDCGPWLRASLHAAVATKMVVDATSFKSKYPQVPDEYNPPLRVS